MTERRAGSEPPILLENEFARVLLTIDREGNAPRLRVEALETGDIGFLDALVLERLVSLSQDELSVLFQVGQYASSKRTPGHRRKVSTETGRGRGG